MFSVYSSSVGSAVSDFTRLAVGNLWFTLFWLCSDFLLFLLSGKAKAKFFFPTFSRMLVCLVNISKGLLGNILNSAVSVLYAFDLAQQWWWLNLTQEHDFLGEIMGWALRSVCLPYFPTSQQCMWDKKKSERKRKSLENHKEASAGGHISLPAANELP